MCSKNRLHVDWCFVSDIPQMNWGVIYILSVCLWISQDSKKSELSLFESAFDFCSAKFGRGDTCNKGWGIQAK